MAMEIFENMRSAGAFRAGVGLLLLALSLPQSVPAQGACPPGAVPQNLEQPQYQDPVTVDSAFIASFVQSFLHTVQPKAFPTDLILEIVRDITNGLNQEMINKVLVYEVGFLVCAAIGMLYIALMPIVGLFLACCRCCGNCGGKMYQKQTSSIHCRRRTLYWATFVTTVIILVGNIFMFKSNAALKVSADQSTGEINKTIENLNIYLTAVPQQVQYVVNESYNTAEEVTNNLDAIGPQLGTEIQKVLRVTFNPALQSLMLMDQETLNISMSLDKLTTSLGSLQSSLNLTQANVTAVKNQINSTFSKADCINCTSLKPELDKLTLDTSITTPDLSELQAALKQVIQADLKSKVKEVEVQLNNIPQIVTNETKNVVQRSKSQLNNIKKQISQVTNDLPLSVLNNTLSHLKQVQGQIGRFTPEIQRAEHIRWSVCVALCCVVLLVVVCNFLGLVLGPLGLKSTEEPTKRSCTANCGGTFFMMGAGFSFLVSWLFMILVLLLFLLGGTAYTMLCQPWKSGELLKVVETPGVIPGFNINSTLGVNITLSGVYRACEANKPVWSALHLNEQINLDDVLNVSKYTVEIQKQFENTNISLSQITFLSPAAKDQLKNFSSKANNLDFTSPIQQINKISRINLNTTADKLQSLASLTTGTATNKELQSEAQSLRQIQADIETTIIPQLMKLNSTIKALRSTVGRINATVGEVLRNVGAAQDFFNKNVTQTVKNESRKFLDCQLGYFSAFTHWANLTITQEIGRCGPVAEAVDAAEIIVCSNMVESLNAFWFSLGWCLIFFIPSIILSIKLAKYYRRMNYTDVFDGSIKMNYIPRAQMKSS